MLNPLLKKKANGFDTPAGKGKVHYNGVYPEAIGGGWNPSDGEDLSGEYSKQLGGYAAGTRGADKTQGFIDGLFRGTQEPPAKKGPKKPNGVPSVRGVKAKLATGEMSRSDVTPENYPIHFAIADAIGGTVEPFDVYQGPYIDTAQGYRLFVTDEEGGMAVIWRDRLGDPTDIAESNAFYHDDEEGAVEAALSLLPDKSKVKKTPVKKWDDKSTDRLMKDIFRPKKEKKLRKVPQFSEEDKIRLHGLGIEGSLKAVWDKAVTSGLLKFKSNRYAFSKDAGVAVRTKLKDTVVRVNGSLNRRHIPKSASAHEAAVKIIAGRVRQANEKLERIYTAATKDKPKCPHCGSLNYSLMPTDFETAKCEDCGKNWDHGIVPGINDPSDKTAKQEHWWPYGRHKFEPQEGSSECKACTYQVDHKLHTTPPPSNPEEASVDIRRDHEKQAFFSPEDAEKFHKENGGSNVFVNEDQTEPEEHEDNTWEPVFDKEAAESLEGDSHGNADCPLPPRERCDTDDADTCCGGGYAYNDKREWVGVPCQCKDCHPPLIGEDHPHAEFIQNRFEHVSSQKTAAVYKVEERSNGYWSIIGLPSLGWDNGGEDKVYPDSSIVPGLRHSLSTPEGLTQGIYEQLYDEFQTNENLKDGDIFDTPVGQFICQGVDVLPHDEKAKAALKAVDEQYKCANCGCDQGDHRQYYEDGYTNYAECKNHPDTCTAFKKVTKTAELKWRLEVDTPPLTPKQQRDRDPGKCVACNGDGHYDVTGSPLCAACKGTGRKQAELHSLDTLPILGKRSGDVQV